MHSVSEWLGRSRFNPRLSHTKDSKRYLIHTCLTLSKIRYVSRVKWSNPMKRIAPSPTLWGSSYWKESLRVALVYGRQLLLICIKIDLVLNNLQWLICHKTKPSKIALKSGYEKNSIIIFILSRHHRIRTIES